MNKAVELTRLSTPSVISENSALQQVRELEKALAVAIAERNSYRQQLKQLWSDNTEEAMTLRYNLLKQACAFDEVIILGVMAPDENRFQNVKVHSSLHPYGVLYALDRAKLTLGLTYPQLFEPHGKA